MACSAHLEYGVCHVSLLAELLRYTDQVEQSAEVLQDGPINRTFKLSWRGVEYIVRKRLPDLKHTNQFFAAERYVYPLLSDSVRVPELVLSKVSPTRRVAVFKFIAGRAPNWDDARILQQLLNVLSAVHSVRGRGIGAVCRPRRVLDQVSYFRRHYAREMTLFSKTAPLSKAEYLLLGKRASGFEMFRDRVPTLCHGDIHPGNFIADSNDALWTIDWEAARFRFPESDFNQMHMNWLTDTQQEQILRDYCAATGHAVSQFRAGVTLFRILWHLRTYNFYVEGLNRDPRKYTEHAGRVRTLLESE